MTPRHEPQADRSWSDEAVLEESARWVHVPPAGDCVRDDRRLLVLLPAREGPSRVWRSRPGRAGAGAMISETIHEARAAGAERLVWHTGTAVSPPFMDDLLPAHGFEKTEELDVLAFDLGADPEPKLPRLQAPPEVRVRLVEDELDLRRAHAVEARVFPASTPKNPDVRAYLAGLCALKEGDAGHETGDGVPRAFKCVASLPNPQVPTVVAAAGAELSRTTLRLWGAATLPEHRSRGAYKALVKERCRLAHALGATLAITKANSASSAPILRAAGFRPVATENRYVLALNTPHHQRP